MSGSCIPEPLPSCPNFDPNREPALSQGRFRVPSRDLKCSTPGSGTRDLVILVARVHAIRQAASLDAGPFDFVDALRPAPQLHAVEFWPPSENFLGDDYGFCISLADHLLAIADPSIPAQQEISIVPHCDRRHLGALLAGSS